jgi:hypothetical protein
MADAIEVVNAIVLLDRNHKILLPADLQAANAYVTNGRTVDFTAAMVDFLAARTKLIDYSEYLATVRNLFYRLASDQKIDGAISWPRWLETYFGAQEKYKKDYFNQLARRPKREKNSPPKTETEEEEASTEVLAPIKPAITPAQFVRDILAEGIDVNGLWYIVHSLTDELELDEFKKLMIDLQKKLAMREEIRASDPFEKKSRKKKVSTLAKKAHVNPLIVGINNAIHAHNKLKLHTLESD